MKLIPLAMAALMLASAMPAAAQMHHRHGMRSCHMEYHHHHRMQVCRR